jgi:hypothetical protein
MDYHENARDDAKEAVSYFLDEIVDEIIDGENANTAERHITDYSDSYHHETHVDRDYNLLEAAQVLHELSEYEVDDSGLWEGLGPRRAIAAMAAYTYGNAVNSLFSDLMEDIYNAVDDAVTDERISWEIPENVEGTDREAAWEEERKRKIRGIVKKVAGLTPDRPAGKKEWRPGD